MRDTPGAPWTTVTVEASWVRNPDYYCLYELQHVGIDVVVRFDATTDASTEGAVVYRSQSEIWKSIYDILYTGHGHYLSGFY
jgi:hypothetical protein